MLSFQELKEKTQPSLKPIQEYLDKGFFHPSDANIYQGLKQADAYEVKTTLDNMSLAEVLINAHTGAGTANIVATKVHDTLIYAARQYDLCPLVGYVTNGWQGGAVTVNIAKDGTFKPKRFSPSAKVPEQEPQFVTTSLTADKLEPYGMNMAIGNDLIEDQAYGLVEWLVTQAGKACGKEATELMLTVLKAGGDGDGTVNTEAAAANETNWLDIQNAIEANARDEWESNTMLTTTEAWTHSIVAGSEIAGGTAGDYGNFPTIAFNPPAQGFDCKFEMLDTKFCNLPPLHAAMPGTDTPGGAMTDCVTLVFDRYNAILTGRKRWLELKNYSNPVEDLANAVVSFRQDSVTLYKDAICVITET